MVAGKGISAGACHWVAVLAVEKEFLVGPHHWVVVLVVLEKEFLAGACHCLVVVEREILEVVPPLHL